MTKPQSCSSDGFCAEVWSHTAELQQAIVQHPFNTGLADGTLDRARFAAYIVQDGRYLVAFGQALSAAATRATTPDDAAFLAGAAREAILEERKLHAGYIAELGLSEDEVTSVRTSPSCLAYTSYLRGCALTESYPVLVAALLPCFWVYHHVGNTILESVSNLAEHPYRAWIETYADAGFAESVRTARQLTDRLAADADATTRQEMRTAFTRATEYEWLFWNSAWIQEEWPTAQWLPAEESAR